MQVQPQPAAGAADCWWPAPFGADDELGMLNHVTADKRRDALALVCEGRLFDLGRVLDAHSDDQGVRKLG